MKEFQRNLSLDEIFSAINDLGCLLSGDNKGPVVPGCHEMLPLSASGAESRKPKLKIIYVCYMGFTFVLIASVAVAACREYPYVEMS